MIRISIVSIFHVFTTISISQERQQDACKIKSYGAYSNKPMIFNLKKAFLLILLSISFWSAKSQSIQKNLNKKLIAKVGDICEETIDSNDCAGIEIYVTLFFNEQKVTLSEKEVTTCGTETIVFSGTYFWNIASNKEITLDFDSKQIGGTYLKEMVFVVKDSLIIGRIRQFNGQVTEHIFKEKL
ncbi:MAG: hypothetical protein R2786_05105 [Flavobacteriaceae bacterium]